MRIAFPTCLALLVFASAASANPQTAPGRVQFNRDIRPILSDLCFQCHGPDKAKRKAKLHFDTEDGARPAVVAGKPDQSELVRRITSTDAEKRMPPPGTGHTLSAAQVALLTRWIAEGAEWQKHWSFITPTRPALPVVKTAGWARNGIDHFVLDRLEQQGLAPSPEADRVTLLRRVSLDLTGLPPTPAEVDAFLADRSPDAYEKVVERLLRSSRYGEHMARHWLDAARYADTNGYQTDGERTMWRWRDWVIEAFNSNMPFDRFTIEQIAGDLLPGATMRQKIATGFNRNHRGNSEGGVIPEEYAVEYVVDRVDTTATVWLGLSAGCAKCHSHKYDPISQKEFYQLFAYFNNVPEKGKAIKYGNSPPYLMTPTREQAAHLRILQAQATATAQRFAALQPEIDRAQAAWASTVDRHKLSPSTQRHGWTLKRGLVTRYVRDGRGGLRASEPDYQRSPFWQEAEMPEFGPGKSVPIGLWYQTAEPSGVGDFGFFDKFTMAARITPKDVSRGSIVSRMEPVDRADGYDFTLVDGQLHVHLVKRWLDDAIRVHTAEKLKAGQSYHVLFSYDGSRLADGVKVYIDGKPAKMIVDLDDLNQSFKTKQPFRIGAGGKSGVFSGFIDDVRIYEQVLDPDDVALVANADEIPTILAVPAGERSAAQRHKLRTYFLEERAPQALRDADAQRQAARRELEEYEAALPTTMVMEEMPAPRPTHILVRGEYDKHGAAVSAAVPTALPAIPAGLPNNRLGLAVWLVAPDNPLTPRVTVNRFWQLLFGAGIVRTVEDFGAQGEWPSHPELLDWLAVEFRDGGWNVQDLLRTIVTSATYRQSSKLPPALKQKDPENRLLSRGPRIRLSAEVIRDQALLASGLLVERIGGPSVRPYQPAGLVKELHGTDEDLQDHGASLYRRSLYTHWKRTVAPPGMTTFDAANRETCVVRQTRTNTPLQSLTLMNDVTFVEAARVLAERVMKAKTTPEDRLTLAFRLAATRAPRPAELRVLAAGLEQHLRHYRDDREAALSLIATGERPRDESLDPAHLAAYTAIANLLLNLDEVITKE